MRKYVDSTLGFVVFGLAVSIYAWVMFGCAVIILSLVEVTLTVRRWLFVVDGQPKAKSKHKESKVLPCLFLLNVLCSYVKSEKSVGVMDRCMKCPHYHAFLREMAEEDEKVMDEIDRMREYELDDG